jgi:small subunit ribosomal protein S14
MKFLLTKVSSSRRLLKKREVQYLALKSIIHDLRISSEIRWEASLLLSKLVDTEKHSRARLKNRCFLTGRSRGYLDFFNLSRIQFRDLARNNRLPFVKKASW